MDLPLSALVRIGQNIFQLLASSLYVFVAQKEHTLVPLKLHQSLGAQDFDVEKHTLLACAAH